jgi:uncharacterized membrane protein (DUF485 family)
LRAVKNLSELLSDPDFLRLMKRRSRLRWGLSAVLVGSYLIYGMAGLYAGELLATPFLGTAVTWSVVIGYAIIFLGIGSSIYYVWQVNRIIAPLQKRLAGQYR